MGYTHYLTQNKEGYAEKHPNYNKVMDALERVAIHEKGAIEGSMFYEGPHYNGKHYVRDEHGLFFTGYESFTFPETGNFSFCKTQRYPFDTAVVACYHIISTLMGDMYQFTSDGCEEDLAEGRALGDSILNN